MNETVVITGAASGMGRELALQYAELGYNLALADVDESGLQDLKKSLEESGANRVFVSALDVSNESEMKEFSEQVSEQFSNIQVVINNAGITRMGTFEGASLDAFRSIMDINFWGVVYGSRFFLPALKRTSGSLVNISSLFGLIGVPGQAAYCASKFAVRGFTESLRQEVKDSDVHVACVHPGGIRTNIARSAVFDEEAGTREEAIERIESQALVMPASKAAEIIRRGIAARKKRILIGKDAKFLDLIARLLPVRYQRVFERMVPAE
ncbi:MAG: short chain dehydrogenase [Cellvibrionaceae bacterium]|nr:short chain dehydrogenase [Cellvibrionaceae bacterium]